MARGRPVSGEPPSPPRGAVPGVFALLVLLWGTTWLVIRIGLDYFPPFFALGVRFCVAGPTFLLIMKLRGDPIPWQPRHQPFFATLAFLSFVVSFGIVYWGEQYITSGLAAVIFALLPLFTAIAAHVLLEKERLGPLRILGVAVGLGGIVVINSGDLALIHPKAPLAALLVTLGPISTALSTVLTKRRMGEFPVLAYAAIPMTYGGIVDLGLWWILERDEPLSWSWPGVGSIAYLAFLGSLVTFGGYFWLLKHIEVNRANLIAYVTPLIAVSIGYLVKGETVTLHTVAGAFFVITGVAIANQAGKGGRRAQGSPERLPG
jgi:drug/metabolite transporter (DMT)-like permease